MQNDILASFQTYLKQLAAEIEAYPTDESLWRLSEGIGNSGGTLCCHLIGNLNHFIGHVLGNTGYVRDRPLEFGARDLPKADLLKTIAEAADMLAEVLPKVDVNAVFPLDTFGECTTQQALLRLLGHFNYHLGQINYHRRLLS